MDRRRLLAAGAAALAGGMIGGRAQAQGTTLRFIYPYAPGDGGDTLLRVLAAEVADKLGVSTIVENHTGADGRIGVRDVKAATPDGNTVLFTAFGAMVLFPNVFANLPYDVFKDFVPVSQLVTYDFGLAVGPGVPARTLPELVDWLKKNPESGNIAVPGLGALPHLLPLKFASTVGVKLQPIAYKGSAPALTEVLAGHVPMICTPLSDLVEQHRAGAIRILAVSGHTRSIFVPDAPNFIEQGYDIEGSGWYGSFAPAAAPRDKVEKLSAVLAAAIQSDAGRARAKQLWLTPTGTTPAQLGAIQRADFDRWAPVIKAAGLGQS